MGTHGRYDGHLGAKETCTLQHSGRGNSARILQSALVAVVGKRPWLAGLCGQTKFEAGRVHFPKGASFLPKLEAELLACSHGKTDDIVDTSARHCIINSAVTIPPCDG